jgi:hypothetical protein
MRDVAMLMLKAGSHSFWCNLWIIVAATVAPSGRWNTAVDMVLVGIVGVEGMNALEVAAVSLTAQGMDPSRTPLQIL